MQGGASQFHDKVVIVTGAAAGIGLSIFEELLNQGAKVIGFDVRIPDQYQEHYISVNIADRDAVESAVKSVVSEHNRVDFLVNCAGILHPNGLLNSTEEEWKRTFDVNVFGAFYVCQSVARVMCECKQGAIVVISSNAAKTPRTGMGSYCASKAALSQMVRCLGLELAAYGIRCNVIAPGSTMTAMQTQLWTGSNDGEKVIAGSLEQFRVGIPLHKIAKPESVRDAALFLLSDQSNHITMETLTVDGGATLGY